ncbi:hypothetical protein PENDEC_c004G02751 [Penicillium decumbens]|uniref:Uncharacterized protein n=1 Tax=Penicillium decumbens TaxID=69771 RepID=A0A1V6PH65_PENDC|nr:hypothetical protein PENDEC_c004G02751 [Penicillium decumbens]
MVALKKLFLQERTSSSTGIESGDMESDEPYFSSAESQNNLAAGHLSATSAPPELLPPGLRVSQSINAGHHFEQLEEQFEELHHHLAKTARPQSTQSQLSPFVSEQFAVPTVQNSRHIDLLDAVSATEKYRQGDDRPVVTPSNRPYNEDVAERNMTRFLRIQYQSGLATSRILSALYQEDVADRNIAKYGGQCRSSSSLSCRSSPPAVGTVSRNGSRRRGPGKRFPVKPNRTSDGDSRARSVTPDAMYTASSRLSQLSDLIRQQRSAPDSSPEESAAAQEDAGEGAQADAPSATQRLGVPPAYKQGKRWSNTPLPDSPTLPTPIGDSGDNSNTTGSSRSPTPTGKCPATTPRSSSLTPRSLSPASALASTSRKNVRDLSINTQLAASGRSNIAHRAIQPPTPSSNNMKRTPSIAEVMNSPLPTSSPVPQSPTPPSPRFKLSEIIDMFNNAYQSTQAISPHPTYETLQDAIVREINSHEAFRDVPVPTTGPLFTPESDQDFDPTVKDEGLSRSASARSISKLMRKGSFKKHRRGAESRRGITTSISRRVGQRRHSDAPPPSSGFLADIAKQQEATLPTTDKDLTYMDVLIRAGNKPSTSHSKNTASRKRGYSVSTANLSTIARSNPNMPNTFGTVHCMQAHSTSSSRDSNSYEPEDSDDEILHLPSVDVSPPRVQIEGVDENNVHYVIDSTTPIDAQKLMSWPQRSRRSDFPQSGCQRSLSPLSRARAQLRDARSVETC